MSALSWSLPLSVPATADTLFHICSSSKTMAAATVMQLVEQRRVDLDAPLSRYVPEFSLLPRFPGSVITVRGVLDMHSGIPGDINNGLISVVGRIAVGATGRARPLRRRAVRCRDPDCRRARAVTLNLSGHFDDAARVGERLAVLSAAALQPFVASRAKRSRAPR